MVDLVDVFVEGAPMKHAMRPVMPCVLDDKEDCDLVGDSVERGKGYARIHAEEDGCWMEEPDLWKLDGKVREEDELGAIPLLGCRRDFLL